MKNHKALLLFLFVSLLLQSCHRNLVDPFIPKDIKHKTQFKFSKTRNRTVEKHFGFARKKGRFNDSFSSAKKSRTGGGFSRDSFSSKPGKKTGGGYAGHSGARDSFGSKYRRTSGLFRFSKKKNSVVSKGSFLAFAPQKRNRESGSFGAKHRHFAGRSTLPGKKGSISRNHLVFSGIKRISESGSFKVRVKRHQGAFGFSAKKKRVTKKFALFRPKDTDAGSFGHGRRPVFTKQYVFNKKTKRVKKRDSIWWDLNVSFRNKKHKKKKPELELFDPEMKRQMKLGR
ncbi:MAG TPA: hypothetical protein PKW80_10655 [Bacteroidales bacterium]|nr:hypothetical protein [Bacteroidales bacterium]